jgi:hypothetical protein
VSSQVSVLKKMPPFVKRFNNLRQFVRTYKCHSPWNCVTCVSLIQRIAPCSLSNEAIDDASAGSHTCEQFHVKLSHTCEQFHVELDKELQKRRRLHHNKTNECKIPDEGKAVVKRNAEHSGYRIAWIAKHCGYRYRL